MKTGCRRRGWVRTLFRVASLTERVSGAPETSVLGINALFPKSKGWQTSKPSLEGERNVRHSGRPKDEVAAQNRTL